VKHVIRTDKCVECIPVFLLERDWVVLKKVKRVFEPIPVLQRVLEGEQYFSGSLVMPLTKYPRDYLNEVLKYCTLSLVAFTKDQLPNSERD